MVRLLLILIFFSTAATAQFNRQQLLNTKTVAVSGGENLLSSSETQDGNWLTGNVTLLTGQTDYAGGTTALKLIGTTTNDEHYISIGFPSPDGSLTYTFGVDVKSGEYTEANMALVNSITYCSIIVNASGAVISSGNGGNATLNGTGSIDLGNGWRRNWISVTFTASTGLRAVVELSNSNNTVFAGNNVNGTFFDRFQVNRGTSLNTYTKKP